jgi:hypothetical protein
VLTRKLQHCQLNADNLLWNIWILLSLPAVWLAWGAVNFCIVIILLLWRIAPGVGEGPLGTSQDADILGPRIAVTVTWAIGALHIFLVVKTFLAWSGSGNIITFDQQKLEEGECELVPESIQLPSGSHRILNAQLPPVALQAAAQVSSIRADIPLAREDDEQGIPMDDFTHQTPPMDRLSSINRH